MLICYNSDMEGKQSRLLVQLLAKQGPRTNQQMAADLGISYSLWRHWREGRRDLSPDKIRLVIARYPELLGAHIMDVQAPLERGISAPTKPT